MRRYLAKAMTDIGNVKKVNQDAAVILEGETDNGRVLMAAVCDGMGGLARGEVASGILAERLAAWFRKDFPAVFFRSGIRGSAIRQDLTRLVTAVNKELAMTAESDEDVCGTTCTLLLMCEGQYFAMNVGDSRIYEIGKTAKQLTKDQTFIRREIDAGRMTEEEALKDPRRNVLLQCIGAGDSVEPDFVEGVIAPEATYMLCSDGFRHKLNNDELAAFLAPERMTDEDTMETIAADCIRIVKERRERDNITVILVRETEAPDA